MSLYLSRLTLRDDPSVAALKELIDPSENNSRSDAHHRLLWSAFSDGPDRKRDFLWRSESRGKFYTLSQRPPINSGLFEPPECKEFSPSLAIGDQLEFVLRANAVKSVSIDKKGGDAHTQRSRGKKVDVAMHLLHSIPGRTVLTSDRQSERPAMRYDLAKQASSQWLNAQGKQHGFTLDDQQFLLHDYSTVSLLQSRRKKSGSPKFGTFDMSGRLTITDPEAFTKRISIGFGRAKAFGQGLMLIKRV